MFSTSRAVDTGNSGTGVFYQAVPAVGADGKNVLKLIPVKVVNGQVCQEKISKPRAESTPQRAVRVSSTPQHMKTTVTPSTTEHTTVPKQLLVVNCLPSQVGSVPGNLVNNPPPQQQRVNLMPTVSPVATSGQNSGRGLLPITVKSPALPRGQYLQIPPNAQVRRVPASELPVGIKEEIFKTSAKITTGSGGPSVIFVSPVTTVSQEGVHTHKTPLKLIPKASNKPNGPIRWVIEDEGSTKAQSHSPPNSLHLISQILDTVEKREKNGHQHCEVVNGAASESNLGKSGQGYGDALVMCNGKVFFVSEKRNLPEKMGQSQLIKTHESSVHQTLEQSPAQKCQNMSIIIPDDSDEVIDLCDDDAQDDLTPISHQEDDTVIFVSYIPPKSDTESVQASCLSGQMNMSSSDSVKGQERRDEGSTLSGEGPSPDTVASTDEKVTHVCGSALLTENEESNVTTQHSTSNQQMERKKTRVEGEAATPAGHSRCDGSSTTHSHTEDESTLSPEAQEMADHQLRQMFGIRADVKIHLQRVDEASAGSVISVLDHQQQQSDTCSSMEGLTQEGHSAGIEPLQHALFKLNSKPLPAVENSQLGQSSVPGTSCDVENAPVINYVEPIDEDFLTSNEDATDQGHAQNTKARRIGRTRKRTTCPCCVPAIKYIKLDELEKWTCGTEQTSKKGAQTKAAGKGWMTPGGGLVKGRSEQKC